MDTANDRAETKAVRRYEPWVQIGNPENFFSLSLGPFRHDHTMDGHKGYLAEEEARWKAAKEKYRRESTPPAGPAQPTTMRDLGGEWTRPSSGREPVRQVNRRGFLLTFAL